MKISGEINIALAIPSFTLGGAETQALLLAESLKSEGFNVEMLAFGKKGALIQEIEGLKIPWSHFPLHQLHAGTTLSRLRAFWKFVRFLKRKKITHLVAFTHHPNVYCGAAWKYAGVKRFYWNQRSVDDKLPFSRMEQKAMKSGPVYIANSGASAEYIRKRHGLQEDQVYVIHNGIKMKAAAMSPAEWRRKMKISDDDFLAVMSANFFPEKDYATLIHAWKEVLQKTDRKVHLAISGEAPGASSALHQMKALAYDLGLCGKISFLGSNSDNPGLFAAANLGILSSLSEGLPNVVLEYMASGLPVVVSDIPGNREALGMDQMPYVFQTGNPEMLADSILKIISDQEPTAVVALKNKIRADHEFSVQQMINAYLKILA